MNRSSFDALALQPALLKNLESLGYHTMTPIQRASLPLILAGRDVIAQARTGSGKTAAFGLGLLQNLNPEKFTPQSLVLCPTRELAEQVAAELRRLARQIHNVKVLTLCGGVPIGPQIGSLQRGAHIIVGTPGRIEDHFRKNTLQIAADAPGQRNSFCLVLDEADRMLEMGFEESVNAIISRLPSRRQTLMFSATYPDLIRTLAGRVMKAPEIVRVETTHSQGSIRQRFYGFGENKQRFNALRLVLLDQKPTSALTFCKTRAETQELAQQLRTEGFSALALHGDLEQAERFRTLARFANQSVTVLVATDVAARGLDIEALDLVVNYRLANDPEVHVHRIGRTGRAGEKGLAISLFSDTERHRLERIGAYMDQEFEAEPLPPWSLLQQEPGKPPMVCLQIDAGRKRKIRPGDLLGALTGPDGVAGRQVGKIHITDHSSFVAIERNAARVALRKLVKDGVKGRSVRVRRVGGA